MIKILNSKGPDVLTLERDTKGESQWDMDDQFIPHRISRKLEMNVHVSIEIKFCKGHVYLNRWDLFQVNRRMTILLETRLKLMIKNKIGLLILLMIFKCVLLFSKSAF